jgi:adenosylhomocysteine nucleosidase
MAGPALGIVAALSAEARSLGATHRSGENRALTDGSLVEVSGIGAEAAERAARALLRSGARALVSWGFAGGLDPSLGSGTLLLPDQIQSERGAVLPTSARWRERLAHALAPELPVCTDKLVTSAGMLDSLADKAVCRQATGAAAVDMESFTIAHAAHTQGVPFLCVRAIVDSAHDRLPRAVVQTAEATSRWHSGRLLRALLFAPREWGEVAHLARRYVAAQATLRRVARSGLLLECLA